MNNKIKEIAAGNGLVFWSATPSGQLTANGKDLEDFAELIVRECVGIANNVHMCRDGRVVAKAIKEHFGVEQ